MIEMPEAVTIARQMNTTLPGKVVEHFRRGPLRHKFLWLNRPEEEYASLLQGKTISGASSFGRSIYLNFGGDCLLWWSDAGGRILYYQAGEELPPKYHLAWDFTDGSHLIFALEMWGAVRLLMGSEFDERPLGETGLAPLSRDFTLERFDDMLEAYPEKKSKGVKGFLVATVHTMPQHLNGLGNAYIQDILYRSGLHPGRKIPQIQPEERRKLYEAIQSTLQQAIDLGGRDEERDLFGQPGRYSRLMSSRTAGSRCLQCGGEIQKITYLGGACYICPRCQTA